jgi:hypothetical protein
LTGRGSPGSADRNLSRTPAVTPTCQIDHDDLLLALLDDIDGEDAGRVDAEQPLE